ncbi:CAP domain-containing protein [Yoonia sp.]|uniref:CAP domain-containing protein n=1 Tax=Yoonia sp. TaxID=2212373 RepID=UPI002DFAA2BC|nr:CAP domain-containing protein [Yoonia sp.]
MNAFRARQGLGPLQVSPALTRAAQAHAEDIAGRSFTQYGLGRSGSIWVQKQAASR